MRLTLDGYQRMPRAQKDEFIQWMRDEGLDGKHIFEAEFGEGMIRAHCYLEDERGKLYLVGEGASRAAASGEYEFRLTNPPPVFVRDYAA